MIQNTTNRNASSITSLLSSIKSIVKEQFYVPSNAQGIERTALVREKATEAIGGLIGAGGAAWLALRITGFSYAYLLFLISSAMLTVHFYRKRQGWLVMQQAIFSAINVSGVYCWILQNNF